jgi:hypothetical protein
MHIYITRLSGQRSGASPIVDPTTRVADGIYRTPHRLRSLYKTPQNQPRNPKQVFLNPGSAKYFYLLRDLSSALRYIVPLAASASPSCPGIAGLLRNRRRIFNVDINNPLLMCSLHLSQLTI